MNDVHAQKTLQSTRLYLIQQIKTYASAPKTFTRSCKGLKDFSPAGARGVPKTSWDCSCQFWGIFHSAATFSSINGE